MFDQKLLLCRQQLVVRKDFYLVQVSNDFDDVQLCINSLTALIPQLYEFLFVFAATEAISITIVKYTVEE